MPIRLLPEGPGYRRTEGETAVCERYFPMIRQFTPPGQRLPRRGVKPRDLREYQSSLSFLPTAC